MQYESVPKQCVPYVKGHILHIKQVVLTAVNTVIVSGAAAGNGPQPVWLDMHSLTKYVRSCSPETHMDIHMLTAIAWPHLEDRK